MTPSLFHSRLPISYRGFLLSIGLLVTFVVVTWIYWGYDGRSFGDDLSSTYVASRLLATGNQDVVYSHDPDYFHIVKDPIWRAVADDGGFKGFLHPYVQIPLWAAALQPLCMSITFNTFNNLFVLLIAISIAGMVWLSTRWLTSFGIAPLPILGLLLWLWFSHPFQYTMFLTQTHPLFLLATLGAVVMAERKKELFAGILLACAAIIKITPALFLIYWAINRKWKAIFWFFVTVIGLVLASLAVTNIELNLTYLSELRRISNVLLVSWNNESLAALIMGYDYPSEIMDWRMLPLPTWLKIIGTCFALGTMVVAGWMRRLEVEEGATISIAFVGMTAFIPIAWSHYFIVLLIPMAYLMGRAVKKPVLWIVIIVLILLTLNASVSLFRPFFGAGMIVLISCITLSVIDIRKRKLSQA